MKDDDLVRRGDVLILVHRFLFPDAAAEVSTLVRSIPADAVGVAAIALADSIRDSQTTIGGGIVAEIDEDAFNTYRVALAERQAKP